MERRFKIISPLPVFSVQFKEGHICIYGEPGVVYNIPLGKILRTYEYLKADHYVIVTDDQEFCLKFKERAVLEYYKDNILLNIAVGQGILK